MAETEDNTTTTIIATVSTVASPSFTEDLIKKYPRANRRLTLDIAEYSLRSEEGLKEAQSVYISPYGLQFRTTEDYPEGTLLKVHVAIPDYWSRKQKYVDYGRVDVPDKCKILVKVVATEEIGKRGKRKMILCKTVNIDEVDEQVLKTFLQEG